MEFPWDGVQALKCQVYFCPCTILNELNRLLKFSVLPAEQNNTGHKIEVGKKELGIVSTSLRNFSVEGGLCIISMDKSWSPPAPVHTQKLQQS